MIGRNIFISYRRGNTEGYAGRIYDRLVVCFGWDRVFRDVTNISVSENFTDAIGQAIGSCQIVIVLIDPLWSTTTDEMGRKRLDDPHDFVHLEVKSALERDILVVPVLVYGAKMPKAEDLPFDLRALVLKDSVEIRHRHIDDDIESLVVELTRYLGEDCGAPTATVERKPARKISLRGWLLIVLILIVGGVSGYPWWRDHIGSPILGTRAGMSATQTALAQIEARDAETLTMTPHPSTVTPSPTVTWPPPTITSTPTSTHTPTITPSPTPYPTQWVDPSGVDMVLIPGGVFTMGTDENGLWDLVAQPGHSVNLGTFYIDKFEVTNTQYAQCVADGGCEAPVDRGSKTRPVYYGDPQYADYPVVNVSWYEAQTYCSWRGGKLPDETEWEKAARGDDGRPYPWGTNQPTCQLANFQPSSACEGDTLSAKDLSAGASPYDVYNLSGNVAEWVRDWFQPYPGGDPKTSQEFGQSYRIIRGGAYFDGPNYIRVTTRRGLLPDASQGYVGFRCVIEVSSLP